MADLKEAIRAELARRASEEGCEPYSDVDINDTTDAVMRVIEAQ